jgi:hypothetical protein
MTPREIYQRMSDESSKAYEAFALYRDTGINRSTDDVARRLGKSSALIQRWSSVYNWVERAAAWDDHVDTQARKKVERDAIKRKADMLTRHALTGKVMQQKGVNYLNEHGIDKSSDAISSIKTGIDIERKSEGLPEWIFEVVNADDNELAREYSRILAEISGVESGDESPGDGDTGTAPPAAETGTDTSG